MRGQVLGHVLGELALELGVQLVERVRVCYLLRVLGSGLFLLTLAIDWHVFLPEEYR